MIIAAEKLAAQNSAYRHRNMKGAFGNEGALRFYNSIAGERARTPAANSGHRRPELGFLVQQRQNFFH